MGDLEIDHVINNLRARRDCLALAHASIKAESDQYNKAIIVLSLGTGLYEAVKFRFGWNSTISSLVPIAISSVVAGISSLIRYRSTAACHTASYQVVFGCSWLHMKQ